MPRVRRETEAMNSTPKPAKNGWQSAWKRSWDDKLKLKAARAEGNRRRSLKYRNDNLEECRLHEREYHRKKLGLPLEAPVMKPWDHAKGKVTQPTP